MTGRQAIDGAMFNLGTLQVGGGPTSAEDAQYLQMLNRVIEGFQTEGIGGLTVTYAVAMAGLTQITSRAVTSITKYTTVTDNIEFPSGWARALIWGLTVEIGGSQGKKQNEMAYAMQMALESKAQIMPKMAAPVPQAG